MVSVKRAAGGVLDQLLGHEWLCPPQEGHQGGVAFARLFALLGFRGFSLYLGINTHVHQHIVISHSNGHYRSTHRGIFPVVHIFDKIVLLYRELRVRHHLHINGYGAL